jgi:hypothetical protein
MCGALREEIGLLGQLKLYKDIFIRLNRALQVGPAKMANALSPEATAT